MGALWPRDGRATAALDHPSTIAASVASPTTFRLESVRPAGVRTLVLGNPITGIAASR